MDTSFISKIVATKEYKFNSVSKNNPLTVYNTNKLLWEIPQSVGIKTGTTQEAGEVLIYEYRKQPVDLIIIVMGSQDRFSDTKNLLYWTLNNYSWEN
jgi:D-alanyl-D-alanine carboxypeptidase